LNQDFVDLLRSFVDGDVRFLLVGAYAVGVHGHVRTTVDMDVWIDATPENAERAYAALAAFGAPLAHLTKEDLSRPGIIFQMGVPPRRIDIITVISGVSFAEAWPHRIRGSYAGVEFPVIGSAELLRNKRATGRPKDLIDVDALEAILRAQPRRQG
jgi:hypothetical protein